MTLPLEIPKKTEFDDYLIVICQNGMVVIGKPTNGLNPLAMELDAPLSMQMGPRGMALTEVMFPCNRITVVPAAIVRIADMKEKPRVQFAKDMAKEYARQQGIILATH